LQRYLKKTFFIHSGCDEKFQNNFFPVLIWENLTSFLASSSRTSVAFNSATLLSYLPITEPPIISPTKGHTT